MIQTLEHNHFTLVGLSRLMCRSFVNLVEVGCNIPCTSLWMSHSQKTLQLTERALLMQCLSFRLPSKQEVP